MYEIVSGMLFDVTLILPDGINDTDILSEHILNVSGLQPERGPESVQQQMNSARRNYMSDDVDNTQEFTINFSLNLNDNNANYIYKTLKEWFHRGYNPNTGERGLKKDYVGTIIIESHNRAGQVFWNRTAHQCFISGGLPALDNDITSPDPLELEVSFIADYVTQSEA